MADGPIESGGFATVDQSGGPVSVPTPAVAFGANVLGEGAKAVGDAAGQASTGFAVRAEQLQTLVNKAASDRATFGMADEQQKYVENFKTQHPGLTAYDASQSSGADLEAIRDKWRGTLNNPMAQSMYDADSRRMSYYASSQVTSFAAQATKQGIKEANAAALQNVLDANTNPATFADPNARQKVLEQIGKYATLDSMAEGSSPEVTKMNTLKISSAWMADGIRTMAVTDAAKAKDILEKNSWFLTDKAKTELTTLVNRQLVPQQVDGFIQASLGMTNNAASLPGRPHTELSGLTPQQVISNFRSNPVGYAEQVTGVSGITIAPRGGFRTPAENAAVGGAANSEHMANDAWDFIPPHGMSVVDLAKKFHDSGVPYDQMEVEKGRPGYGPHVHIGLRDSNLRNEVIGNGAGDVRSASQVAPDTSTVCVVAPTCMRASIVVSKPTCTVTSRDL